MRRSTVTGLTVQTVQKTGDSPGAVLWMMSTCTLLCNRQGYGSDRAKLWCFAVAVHLTRWSMSVAVHRRYGSPCDHAATVCPAHEVPQTQFIAGVGGHSCAHKDGMLSAGMAAVNGFFRVFFRIFRLSASFRSPRRRRVLRCRGLLRK